MFLKKKIEKSYKKPYLENHKFEQSHQSYLDARFTEPECTLIEPNMGGENQICWVCLNFLKKIENI